MRKLVALATVWCVCLALEPLRAAAQSLTRPVNGPWAVVQGPLCPNPNNHHCGTPNQQFAYDLIPLDQMGRPNAMLCVGQPVMSPTDGIVIAALDMYPNTPQPGQHPAGNHIVIQRSSYEFILIAHLSPRSLTVTTNSRVAAGQVIGACGHNGSSSAPHVHIHMQDTPNVLMFASRGLPMYFSGVGMMVQGGGCSPIAGGMLQRGMVMC